MSLTDRGRRARIVHELCPSVDERQGDGARATGHRERAERGEAVAREHEERDDPDHERDGAASGRCEIDGHREERKRRHGERPNGG